MKLIEDLNNKNNPWCIELKFYQYISVSEVENKADQLLSAEKVLIQQKQSKI